MTKKINLMFLLTCIAFLMGAGAKDKPLKDDIYLRGNFNNWKVANKFEYDKKNGYYHLEVNIKTAQTLEFKIADKAWQKHTTYSAAPGKMEFGFQGKKKEVNIKLQANRSGFGNNTKLFIAKSGKYKFTFKIVGKSTSEASLTVTQL